jgi:N6-adenosine-specific RNA methylase IME4
VSGTQGAVVRVQDVESFLASLDQAKRFLAACDRYDDAKQVRDKAVALRAWSRAHGDARDLGRAAGHLELRALRRMGELAPEKLEPEEVAAKGGKAKSASSRKELAQTPAEKRVLHRARAVAAIPAAEWEATLAKGEKPGSPIPRVAPVLKEARRAEVRARAKVEVAAHEEGLYRNLDEVPRGVYRCLYADPAWEYDDEQHQGGVSEQYGSMTPEVLAALPVPALAHPGGAHLWLWATWPKLRDGVPQRLLSAWGFRWVGEVVWDKAAFGVGRWLRPQTEVLILAVRGSLPLLVNDQRGFFSVARGRHSVKPAEARAIVERCSPGPRLELFGRAVPPGWDAWGNQVERTKS